MRVKQNISLLALGTLLGGLASMPVWAQSLSQGLSQGQQPSQQQIERFCANWGQLSDSEQRQYQAQYEEYCDRPSLQPETTIIQPEQPQQQQPSPQQQPQKPQEPAEPEAPEPEMEPQIEPARPEPVIPEPAPRRVDLVGEVALAGPVARQPGERQRLRVTVENRGPGGGPHAPAVNRLWARVFLSDRDVSRQGASAGAFAFSGARQGHPVRLPGLPGPGRSREVTTEVTLPAGMPDGSYWWCVRLDTRQQVEETEEGNNTACVRKVVALGGQPDSDLSDLFGSRVDELQERADVGEQARIDVGDAAGTPRDLASRLPEPEITRDLEIVWAWRLGPPAPEDAAEPYPVGDAELGSRPVLGQPVRYGLDVRNNGVALESFLPYYILDGDDAATLGVGMEATPGLSPTGGIEIAPGETKTVELVVDLSHRALNAAQLKRIDNGQDVKIKLFLGEVDASGDSFDERVFRDEDMENHVTRRHPHVVKPVLHRVVLRDLRFWYEHPSRIANLRRIGVVFGRTHATRWLTPDCGSGGGPNARLVAGDRGHWEADAFVVGHDTTFEVDFDRACGMPAAGGGATTSIFVAWSPLNTRVPVEIRTRQTMEGSGETLVEAIHEQDMWISAAAVAPVNCLDLPVSSEYYKEAAIDWSGGGSILARGKYCLDRVGLPEE